MQDNYGTPNKNGDDEYQNSPLQPNVQVLGGNNAMSKKQTEKINRKQDGGAFRIDLKSGGIDQSSRITPMQAEMLKTTPVQ